MALRDRYIKYRYPKLQNVAKPNYDVVAYHRDVVYFNRKKKREQRLLIFLLWFSYQKSLVKKAFKKLNNTIKRTVNKLHK